MNANLIFNWLKDPRFKPDATETEETVFLPVEVSATDIRLTPSPPDPGTAQLTGSHITIELSNGHRLSIEGNFDGGALARLLKGLVS